MAEKSKSVRRKRRVRSIPGVDTIRIFRHRFSPERLAMLTALVALAVVVGIVCFTYGARFYNGWRETRLLKRASALLQQHDYAAATKDAHDALLLHPDSLSAFYILAETS